MNEVEKVARALCIADFGVDRLDDFTSEISRHYLARAQAAIAALDEARGDPVAIRNAALEEPAATITDLRARIAELEADKAQWVEIERMQLGISEHTPQSTPAHSQAGLDSRSQRG